MSIVPDPAALRAIADTLAEHTEQELGAGLLSGFQVHRDRDRAAVSRWSAVAIELADEIAAAEPGLEHPETWATDHGIAVEDVRTAGTAPDFVMSQYHVSSRRILVLGPTLDFAGDVMAAVGWGASHPRSVLRGAAIGHELAHHLLDDALEKDLRHRLGEVSLRWGRRRRYGYVMGADEVVAHCVAGRIIGDPRSGLLMAAVLQEAVGQVRAASIPSHPVPKSASPTTRDRRSPFTGTRPITERLRSRPWES